MNTTRNVLSFALVALTCASLSHAQMMVHAVSGVVKAVTPNSITVQVNANQQMPFEITTKQSADLPGDLRAADVMPPSSFKKVGDFVLVFYYGYGDQRTAIGVKDFGDATLTKMQGTVTAYDKHTRTMTMTDSAGKQISLQLSGDMVVDTDHGLDEGRKFQPHKGDSIRLTYKSGTPAQVVFLGEQL